MNLPSDKVVGSYVHFMRKLMTGHVARFVTWLNRNYPGINARIKVNRFVRSPYWNPREQVPGTHRKIYQVISYQIVTGKNDATDLVDTALAVYPGSGRHMIHVPLSYRTGIPIQKVKYQVKDSLALLSGSFLYDGLISQRNPLTGKHPEKGEKNTERALALLRVSKKNKKSKKSQKKSKRSQRSQKKRNQKRQGGGGLGYAPVGAPGLLLDSFRDYTKAGLNPEFYQSSSTEQLMADARDMA
jgi:hypothetical protein